MSSFNCVTKRYDLNTDWEQRKLDDVSETSIGGGTPATTIKKYWNGEIPWIQSSDLKKNKYFDVDIHKFITTEAIANSAAKLIKKDSITIVTRVGVGKLALIGHDFTTSQDFLSLSNLKIDKLFGIYSISKILDSAVNSMQGTSIKGVTKKELLKYNITLPSNSEQTKVGKLLKNLDNAIALHLFKLETLKKLKQGYLHVMFPENQHPIPYLRFANFSSPWKQRRLGEVAKIQGGGTPSSENTEYWDGHINWFTPTEVFNNGYLLKSKRKITNIGLLKSSAKVLPVGTILMTSRAGVGSMGILTEPAATNQGFQSLILKNMSMSYFVYSMQEIISKKANRLASGSTFTEISGKEVAKMSIIIPNSNDEIKYIGNLFLKLDNAIDLHQTKIEKLQQIKKAYLQKMFI